MAATQASQLRTSSILAILGGTAAAGLIGYAVYFDYKRRTDPEFRRALKRESRRHAKAAQADAAAQDRARKSQIKTAVDKAVEEGFPTEPEELESYFMQEVAKGETMCSDGSEPVDAALCFYKALKVYPQPRDLINIYDKTVPKPVLDILAEMIAVDSSISIKSGFGSVASDSGSAGNVED